jgi:DNA-binding transcriptional MerR regulator
MNDPLIDIWQFSPTLTISQVLTFFERKGMALTRAMVQNYIRLGLLPPPNGRIYTHKHLAALVLIDKLKSCFGMDEIRDTLRPLMDDEGLPLDTYTTLLAKTNALLASFAKVATPEISSQPDGGILLTMLCTTGLRASV